MRNHHKILLLILCIFSLFCSLSFIKIYQYPVLGDERTYYAYGVNLSKGNGYSYQALPPFTQSNLREPAYLYFIGVLFKIFGESKNVIQISQAILNSVIVFLSYHLANLLLNDNKKALFAAFLVTISPAIAGYAALIASETLALIFAMLAMLSLLVLLKEGKHLVAFSILVGLLCGCLVLTKMTYFLFPILICLVLLIVPADKFSKYTAVLCITITFIAVLLHWLSFNNKIYGNPFFLTNRGGVAITIKAERLNWTPKETLVSFVYSVSEGLVQRYFPNEYKKVTYNPVEGSAFKTAYDKYGLLISHGYSEMAADKQLRIEALNKIKQNIPKYIILSISDFHYMLYFEGVPLAQFTDFFKREVRGAINLFFKIYSLIIIFFAGKGIFVTLRNKENRFLKIAFLLPVLYTFLIYSAIFGAPRFTFTIIPFIYILASVGICELIKVKIPL